MIADDLVFIAYVSDAQSAPGQQARDLQSIEEHAKQMNPKYGITGVLFHHEGHYLQVVEGSTRHVRRLMENIYADARHSNVEMLVEEPIETRGFGSWNMDCFDLSGDTPIERNTFVKLAHDYKQHVLPRADILVTYYKALLEKGE